MGMISRTCKSLIELLSRTEGQDLVEYALLVAVVSLGAVASLRNLALDLNILYLAIIVKFTAGVLGL